MSESRRYNAEYYDAITTQTDDIDFYKAFITTETYVLELGCGTGRVSFPLAKAAKRVVGVDISDAMISRAKSKNSERVAEFILGDICSIQLHENFDLIIAPFRVMQALELDEQVAGFLEVIRRHLHPEGTAILNVFRPFLPKHELPRKWVRENETQYDEIVLSNGDVLRTSDTRTSIDPVKQVMHPEIIHRLYRDGKLVDEHVNPICMRYYYPDEFKKLVTDNGFKIVDSWGGYKSEKYGEGPELVVALQHG